MTMPDMTKSEAQEFFVEQDKAHYIVYDGHEFRLGDVNGNYSSIPDGVLLSYLVTRFEPGEPTVRAVFEGKGFTATVENGFWWFA